MADQPSSSSDNTERAGAPRSTPSKAASSKSQPRSGGQRNGSQRSSAQRNRQRRSNNQRSNRGGQQRNNRPRQQAPRADKVSDKEAAEIERSLSGFDASSSGPLSQSALDAERRANVRWPLIGSIWVGVPIGVIAFLATFWLNLIGAIVLGLLTIVFVTWIVLRGAPTAVQNNIAAVEVPHGQLARVEVLLQGLSATMGVATPKIEILADPIANAGIYWRKDLCTIVITTGLMDQMTVVELEGVFAHLLAQIRLESVRRGTAGAGIALLIGPLGRRPGRVHRLTGEGRLWRADEVAALTVRYPSGLKSALEKMTQGPVPEPDSFFSSRAYGTLRWLFIDPSIGQRAKSDEIGDLDATGVRIQALAER